MNLHTVKWAQCDKTQSRELFVCFYVCALHCAQLLHTIDQDEPACKLSHTRTVVRECCKGDDQSQWRRANFNPPPPLRPKPLNRSSPKLAEVITSGISTTMQNFIQIG